MRPVRNDEERHRPWHVPAVDYRGSSKRHDRVEATGRTEAEALRDLAELLRLWIVEHAPQRAELKAGDPPPLPCAWRVTLGARSAS